MAICYDKLFHLLIDKRMSNSELKEKAGFSANIITRLNAMIMYLSKVLKKFVEFFIAE